MERTETEGTGILRRTPLGGVVMMYPSLLQAMEGHIVEWLGSGGHVIMMQEGETYMRTVIEQLQARFKPSNREEFLALLTKELRETGWGRYTFSLHEPDKKGLLLEGTDIPFEHGAQPTYFWFMMGMLKAIVERAFDARINIRKTDWFDGNRVKVELELDGEVYLGPASDIRHT